MNVFDDKSTKQREALGFASISSGLRVERSVMKTIAFSSDRAMPRMGRERNRPPSEVVIMHVAMRSTFFQMKDNCSSGVRFELGAGIFSFIVSPVLAECDSARFRFSRNGASRAMFVRRKPLTPGGVGQGFPWNRRRANFVRSTCNRFPFVTL